MSQAPNHDLQTLLMAMGAQLNFLWLGELRLFFFFFGTTEQ